MLSDPQIFLPYETEEAIKAAKSSKEIGPMVHIKHPGPTAINRLTHTSNLS